MATPTHWERLWPIAAYVVLVAVAGLMRGSTAMLRWKRLMKRLGPHKATGLMSASCTIGGREVAIGHISNGRYTRGGVVLDAPCRNQRFQLLARFPARPRLFRADVARIAWGLALQRVAFGPEVKADVYSNVPAAVALPEFGRPLADLSALGSKVQRVVTQEGSSATLALEFRGFPSAAKLETALAALAALAAAVEAHAQDAPLKPD